MRSYYGLRSTLIGTLAALASLLIIAAPAAAEIVPLDSGIYAAPSLDFDFEKMHLGAVQADHVAIVPQRLDPAPVIAVAGFKPLKPEYAESYATHGLVFIDLHRRC